MDQYADRVRPMQHGTHLLDNGVVGSGGVVADAVDDLERLLGLGVDAVVRLFVLVEESVGRAGEAKRKSAHSDSCAGTAGLTGFRARACRRRA